MDDGGFKAVPCWKEQYRSKGAATDAMHKVLQRRGVRPGKKASAFLCERCRCWHWGHLENKKSGK